MERIAKNHENSIKKQLIFNENGNKSIFSERRTKKANFEEIKHENFRYKSHDDLSEYLNERFGSPLRKSKDPPNENEKNIIKIMEENPENEENKQKNIRQSKESSIKQIEIEPNNTPRQHLQNLPSESRMTEEEISKYIKKLYLSMNLKSIKFFLMFIYVSAVFLYNLPIITLFYANMCLEIYHNFIEILKWRKDSTM